MARKQGMPSWLLPLLVVVIAFHVVAVRWAWNYYNRTKIHEDENSFDLSAPPSADESKVYVPSAHHRPAPKKGGGFLVDLDKFLGDEPSRKTRSKRGKPGRRRAEAPASPAGGGAQALVRKAKSFYYGLKKDSKFRRSKAVRGWTREFLGCDDLRKINAEYQKDRDAVKFVTKVVRSPNFIGLVTKYMMEPDIQDFIGQMQKSKDVMASTAVFGKDPKVKQMFSTLPIQGGAGISGTVPAR